MQLIGSYGAAIAGVFRRDLALYLSYRTSVFTQIFSALFSVTLFYYMSRLVTVGSFSPERYFEFVLIGLVILQAITGTIAMLPVGVRQELVTGTFERLVLSPFGAVAGVLAMIIFPFVRAVLLGAVMVLYAMLLFGLRPAWPDALLAFPVAALGALAFTPFSLFFTAAVFAFKQAPGTGLVLAIVSLLAGLYFPVALLPDWIEWTSQIQPFTPAVDVLRHVLVGSELSHSVWLELARLAGFAVVLLPVAVFTMAAALRFGQRKGTVSEF
jgi:ABC-2 type transport system permease protein